MTYHIAILISTLASIGFYLAAENIAKGRTRIAVNLVKMVVFGVAGASAPINAYGFDFGVILASVPLQLLTGFLLVLAMKFLLIFVGICSYEDIWSDYEK